MLGIVSATRTKLRWLVGGVRPATLGAGLAAVLLAPDLLGGWRPDVNSWCPMG
ncbi:MAG: hypothetical protein ACJ716_09665 [Marmoricola sp.]